MENGLAMYSCTRLEFLDNIFQCNKVPRGASCKSPMGSVAVPQCRHFKDTSAVHEKCTKYKKPPLNYVILVTENRKTTGIRSYCVNH